MFREPFALLLGRKTYEIFAAHWPHQRADDPIASAFNAATNCVERARRERVRREG